MEILQDFEYEEVTEIFVRVNSGGRALKTTDLALATLSARSPGFLGQLEAESAHWAERGYGGLDVNFLIKAITLSLSASGKRLSSVARLTTASRESVQAGWNAVQTGLGKVVPLLQERLLVPSTALIPSLAALHPLVVCYGRLAGKEQPTPETEQGSLLVHGGNCTQSVRWRHRHRAHSRHPGTGCRGPSAGTTRESGNPRRRFVRHLPGFGRPQSPEPLLAFLLSRSQARRCQGLVGRQSITATVPGSSKIEYSLIHPAARLRGRRGGYSSAEINELANLVFVSHHTAKNIIADRSPSEYLKDVVAEDLSAHAVPSDSSLLDPESYRRFLEMRRDFLARRITELLGSDSRPSYLASAQTLPPQAGSVQLLSFTGFADEEFSVLVAQASLNGREWSGTIDTAELEAALKAAESGLASDVTVGGEAAPMMVNEEMATLRVGPCLVSGSLDEWRTLIEDTLEDAQPLENAPKPADEQWLGELEEFVLAESRQGRV